MALNKLKLIKVKDYNEALSIVNNFKGKKFHHWWLNYDLSKTTYHEEEIYASLGFSNSTRYDDFYLDRDNKKELCRNTRNNFGGQDINVNSHLMNNDINPLSSGVKLEPQATLQTLSYMISLQSILKDKKYCFINYHELDKDVVDESYLSEIVDWSKFIYIDNVVDGLHGKLPIHDDNLHHDKDGAQIIFEKLKEYFRV